MDGWEEKYDEVEEFSASRGNLFFVICMFWPEGGCNASCLN